RKFPGEFHLRLEFRASLKADSGVYVRGPQLQVRDFIRRNEHKHLKKFHNDGWNTLDIVVRNKVLTTTVNGKGLSAKDSLELSYKDGKPEQQRAVAVVEGLGGQVELDEQRPEKPVVGVNLSSCQEVTDEDLAALKPLP